MEADEVRAISRRLASKAGLTIPTSLPLLDGRSYLRDHEEVVCRLLCLTALAAVSYGFDRIKALDWLRQEELESKLTKTECNFIELNIGSPHTFQMEIEGQWALAWALNLVPKLDFWKDCDGSFVMLLPDLKISQGRSEWQQKARPRLRSIDNVIAACDLAYCLHWAVRQNEIDGRQPIGGLKSYLVVERRRALEWLLGDEAWDELPLDT